MNTGIDWHKSELYAIIKTFPAYWKYSVFSLDTKSGTSFICNYVILGSLTNPSEILNNDQHRVSDSWQDPKNICKSKKMAGEGGKYSHK